MTAHNLFLTCNVTIASQLRSISHLLHFVMQKEAGAYLELFFLRVEGK